MAIARRSPKVVIYVDEIVLNRFGVTCGLEKKSQINGFQRIFTLFKPCQIYLNWQQAQLY